MDSGRIRQIRERRALLQKDKGLVEGILRDGRKKAGEIAQKTMVEVKELLHLAVET